MDRARNGTSRLAGPGDGHVQPLPRRHISKNKQWVAADVGGGHSASSTPVSVDPDRWERRGAGGRGRGFGAGSRAMHNRTLGNEAQTRTYTNALVPSPAVMNDDDEDMSFGAEEQEPELNTQEEREKFWQELVKAREVERKLAISEGKMDDPLVPKRLEDAITMVGTCMDMCPRFERYRRERENNLFELECIPGTKRVDHRRAVKQYERAAGDKTLPSDLRPPSVLQGTLDYLFHDLLPRGGLQKTAAFIRDRSRAVRNDFTMQHETGRIAMECHDRCVRFHILVMHLERDRPGFSCDMEEQQLMNSLQSLKEFYEDQRGRYESPSELEMRVYHRLIHIRDQKERHEEIPEWITNHPAFKLTTKFRLHVQARSAPITKKSALLVDAKGMEIFAELAGVLRDMGNKVMCYLVACILERLFGSGTVDDIDAIRGDLSLQDIIDGISVSEFEEDDEIVVVEPDEVDKTVAAPSPIRRSATSWLSENFGPNPTASAIFGSASQSPASNFWQGPTEPSTFTNVFPSSTTNTASTTPFGAPQSGSAFANASSTPNNAFSSAFGGSGTTTPSGSAPKTSAFGLAQPKSVFGATLSGPPKSVFGGPSFVTTTTGFPEKSTAQLATPVPAPTTSAFASSAPFGGAMAAGGRQGSTSSSVFGASSASPFAQNAGSSNFAGSTVGKATSPFGAPLATPRLPPSNVPQPPSGIVSAPKALPATSPPKPSLNPKAPTFMPSFGVGSKPSDTPTMPTPSRAQPSTTLVAPFPSEESTKAAATPLHPPTEPPLIGASDRAPPEVKLSPTRSNPASTPSSLPRIITNPLSTPTAAPFSPKEPPPLNKQHTIPLPSTPSITPATSILVGSALSSPAFPSSGILSPLLVWTPTGCRPLKAVPSITIPEVRSNARASPTKLKERLVEGVEPRAVALCRRGWLVKRCFARWVQRAMDRAEWQEACRHSDAYKEKVRLERSLSRSSSSQRKRPVEPALVSLSPERKRVRRRRSTVYQPPRTDEDLAQRLQENQEEHQRRWAKGSFLEVLRAYVRRVTPASSPSPDWRAWVSTNPDNDGTAVWLEHKFNIPASGEWESESIFSIPVFDEKGSTPCPGIIFFECTPLERLTDEIERKYHILDDCSRLRDLIHALPKKRHYVPSLMVFSWTEDDRPELHSDLLEMIAKAEGEGLLGSHHVYAIASSTKDFDGNLRDALELLKPDVEGKLVMFLALDGLFGLFESPWRDFVTDCIESPCSEYDFDWYLLGKRLAAAIELLNTMGQTLTTLLSAGEPSDLLGPIDSNAITDFDSAFGVSHNWLSSMNYATGDVVHDLQSYQQMGHAFPEAVVLEHMHHLLVRRIQSKVAMSPNAKVAVAKRDIIPAIAQFKDKRAAAASDLRHAQSLRLDRSPRRRSFTDDSDATRKRARLSSSQSSVQSFDLSSPETSPMVNGRASPTPSTVSAVTADDKPLVTVAMLRALTRNVKEKYGR